jgi:creatinine amidohydrolase/Fe(II)-dependent formamide hydrolase-like protein
LVPSKSAARRAAVGATLFCAVFAYVYVQQSTRAVSANDANLPSLHIEDLTWTEVAAAQARGYATMIIPTGGTEQNGPHVILGKHNYIVAEASARLARALGGTLVAPVISYVPEGAVGDSPDLHMRWTGTVSVPDDVFAAVLDSAARSYKTHGFQTILFVGDSFGNQDAQAAVAQRLSAEWEAEGVRVLHLGDYYAANGQISWLKSQGHTEPEIGGHAGIRDTSELMAVHPGGVRAIPVSPPKGADPGYSGAPAKASAELGERMLTLKVEAALRQLKAAGITSGLAASQTAAVAGD